MSNKTLISNKPRWTLPGSLNDPLAFIFFGGLFSIVKDYTLYSRSIKCSSFLFTYFPPYLLSLCFDFRITITTKNMLQFQVSTLGANIYVPLDWYELARIPPPAAVHLDAASFLRRRHPQDAAEEARPLSTLCGARCRLRQTSGGLDGRRQPPERALHTADGRQEAALQPLPAALEEMADRGHHVQHHDHHAGRNSKRKLVARRRPQPSGKVSASNASQHNNDGDQDFDSQHPLWLPAR